MSVLTAHAPQFATAFGATIVLLVLAWIGALIVGTGVATMRLSVLRPARAVGLVYVAVFRNTPLPVQMVLFVFGLPLIGISYSLFTSAVVVLVIYTAAFVAETLLAGVNTVPTGEIEAARALGFGPMRVLRTIVLPQAFAAVVQPLGNVLITMMKNTSVAAIVGVAELTFAADEVAVQEASTFVVFGAAIIAYLVLGLILGACVGSVERKVTSRR
ncbi:MAG: amino acid ABC transporter permease [Sciscionella sp.]